jgi:acetyl esterase/lipase
MKKVLFAVWLIAFSTPAWSQSDPGFKRTRDVIYGRKLGVVLTMDVFQPSKPNGHGILLMISGGWHSSHDAISAFSNRDLLDRGYTVFAVVHGSQPKFNIPEIVQDIHRAVRFVRHNAAKYEVTPDRLGIAGASAGGHLSLMMATTGSPGKEDAKDPIDRQTSAVQAVACFFPPTDFMNWSEPGDIQVGIGKVGSQFKAAFGPRSETDEGREKLGREISPLYHVTSNTPPILMIHGDKDKLVPIYQAELFEKKCKEVGVPVKLIVREGADHGWKNIGDDMKIFADWFDERLRAGAGATQ